MAHSILVIGGTRSGKSRHAEELAATHRGKHVYIATAEAGDEEMAMRIAAHQARRGRDWITVQEPLELVSVLRRHADEDSFVLVDCLTLWLSNLMLEKRDIAEEVEDLCEVVKALPGRICIVTNEIGLGIVPETPLGRYFRDEAGFANQLLAQTVDEAVLMVAGLPLKLK